MVRFRTCSELAVITSEPFTIDYSETELSLTGKGRRVYAKGKRLQAFLGKNRLAVINLTTPLRGHGLPKYLRLHWVTDILS